MAPAETTRRDGETGRGRLESACAHTIHTHTEERVSVQPLRLPVRMRAAAPSLVAGDCFFFPFSFLFCDPVRALQGMGGTDEGGQREQIREGELGWVGGGEGHEGPLLRWALTSLRAGRPAALHGSARVWEMASHISVPSDRTRPWARRAGKTRKEGRGQDASRLLGVGTVQLQSSIFLT